VRWDGGFEAGNDVTLFYDSLLGKVIAWGATRDEAIGRMRRALEELVLTGVATNQAFHLRLLADEAFLRSEIDSQFLDRRPDLLEPLRDDARLTALAVAAALAEDEARQSRRPVVQEQIAMSSAWQRAGRLEGAQ
jgi:acetyl-CoA carboxylase biotin carboxylase subunit